MKTAIGVLVYCAVLLPLLIWLARRCWAGERVFTIPDEERALSRRFQQPGFALASQRIAPLGVAFTAVMAVGAGLILVGKLSDGLRDSATFVVLCRGWLLLISGLTVLGVTVAAAAWPAWMVPQSLRYRGPSSRARSD